MISNRKYIITTVVLAVLVFGSFFGGLKLGQKGYVYSGHDFRIVNQNDAPKNVNYDLLWQALDVINSKYIDKPVDQQKILYGAVAGAVAAVGDPYTTFFDPKQYSDFKTELAGTFDGIGAEVGLKDNRVEIVSPLNGSPAKAAGLLPGDIIEKIDGQDASNYTLDQAVNDIRGPSGTKVDILIYRQSDQKEHDFNITRAAINVNSVEYSVKQVNGKNIEYINIQRFGDDTVLLFTQAAADAIKNKAAGIVLDLRDDPGGYLDAAVQIASYWVDPGKLVVSEKHSDGTQQDYTARGNNSLARIPTMVLINGGTASAAEILSGALHDYGFAKLIGEKSFGKGSVQELVDMPENTAIKVTVAKWLTPKGVNLNHNGLDPDIKVTRTAEQIQNNQDPQLDTALQQLK